MTKYEINNKPYFTICSVQDDVNEIFNKLKKINPLSFKTPTDLYEVILKEIKFGNQLIEVAKQMGQRMEDTLKYRTMWGIDPLDQNSDDEVE